MDQGESIAAFYETNDYAKAMRAVLELADRANAYVEHAAPWQLKKEADKAQELQDVCSTVALNLYRQIIVYLSPVLPLLSEQTGVLLQAPIQHWGRCEKAPGRHTGFQIQTLDATN